MRIGRIILAVLILFGIASIGLAGSERVKQSVDTTIKKQTIQTDRLQQRLENIQRLVKPIKIPEGVRIKKQK